MSFRRPSVAWGFLAGSRLFEGSAAPAAAAAASKLFLGDFRRDASGNAYLGFVLQGHSFSSLVLGLSAQMHIDVLFSSEQASCQLSRHSCLFHQPLIKLEHCGICSRPISHLHQVYFARYCFTFSNSCMVRKTCGTLRMFTSAREPLLILFRGRRQGRQPLNYLFFV